MESSVQTKSKVETSNYPPALEERLSTTERILGINRPVPKDVYQRIKVIEDRILFLESTSPEYKNLWVIFKKKKRFNQIYFLNDRHFLTYYCFFFYFIRQM